MRHNRKTGVVLVGVVVLLFVILGFAVFAIDSGVLYNTKGDLQIVADAASLAGASQLSHEGDIDEIKTLAKDAARSVTNKNRVLGHKIGEFYLCDSDFEFLNAYYVTNDEEASSHGFDTSEVENYPCYLFKPATSSPDAIRVTAKKTNNHQNGPVYLIFANLFGLKSTNVTASATAVLVPRDISLVADLSASHTDDSELRNYKKTQTNLYDVWDNLPGGIEDNESTWDNEIPAEWIDNNGDIPQASGPGWGYMKQLGYGTLDWETEGLHSGNDYSPESDEGFVRLAYNQNWTDTSIEAYLINIGYSQNEVSDIMSSEFDSNGVYKYRVALALGLARWNSGQQGGLWETHQIESTSQGNANGWIGSNELEWVEPILGASTESSESIWLDYIQNYTASSSTTMYNANSSFRYRYGIKTFVNYLMDRRPQNNKTPELSETPTQPMQAVKNSVNFMVNFVSSMDTEDLLSLEVYGRTAHHEVDLTKNYADISNRLSEMQAGHYDTWTNVGGGLQKAIEELSSERARKSSRKVIILLTDGIANTNEHGQYNEQEAADYAIAQTEIAANMGIKVFAVSVGSSADVNLMNQIADLGNGKHLHASGDTSEYSQELILIFQKLCSSRDFQLVE